MAAPVAEVLRQQEETMPLGTTSGTTGTGGAAGTVGGGMP